MYILGISLTVFFVFLLAGHLISKTLTSERKKVLIFVIVVVLGALVSATVGALLTWQNILKALAL